MKRFLKILIPLLVVGAVVYHFRTPLEAKLAPTWEDVLALFSKTAPCSAPIPYTLGSFAKEFNISPAYFLSALSDAEAVWEKPAGVNLFQYEPTDTATSALKINLIYDYRQQATSKLQDIGITVANTRASYDSLKAKYTTAKADFDQEKTAYDAALAEFNQKDKAYEDQVKYWNDKGGAPKSEFDKLQATKSELQAESKQIQTMQKNLNNTADEVNALVVVLNRLVSVLNLSVAKYNTTNDALGESFEEGVYSTDGLNRKIDIYEFTSREKLVRVLAHELGHALGLGHVADPKAIMYEFNQGSSLALTTDDFKALRTECGARIK